MKHKLFAALLAGAAALSLAACAQTDVVARVAVTSFGEMATTADIKADETNGGWSLTAPDGTARFILSNNFGATTADDVKLIVDAQPFINAGLDTSKLPAGTFADGKLSFGQELGSEQFPESAMKTAPASFEQLVKVKRDAISYHQALDHYGVDVGGGNKFEWAKDMSKNDKDIVFVLDPKVFTDAGVDPAMVEGWTFAKVEVLDEKGGTVQVDKLLKPFNLK